MTQQEIQERNKQIATMLGWKEATLEYKLKWCGVPTEERLNRMSQDYIPILMKENKEPIFGDTLRWHLDWNCLMEAVYHLELNLEKNIAIYTQGRCTISGYVGEYKKPYVEIDRWSTGSKEFNYDNKKEVVFLAVSDFAQKFNNKEL